MPSTGAVVVPGLLELLWLTAEIEFIHDTAIYYLPPGLDVTIRWSPEEEDKVFVIFAVTLGEPRRLDTGEVIYTDEIGFWHRGLGMKLHWNPLVPSITNIVYPHITPTTKENPFEIRFVNRTNVTVYIDVTVWYMEMTREKYREITEFIKGLMNYYRRYYA